MTNEKTITLEWVRAEKTRHSKAIAEHEAALADLNATERVMLNAQQTHESGITPYQSFRLKSLKNIRAYGRKKKMLLTVIQESLTGLTTQDVISAAIQEGFENLKIDNVSPQLSGYKSDELLELAGGLWRITDKGRQWLAAQKD